MTDNKETKTEEMFNKLTFDEKSGELILVKRPAKDFPPVSPTIQAKDREDFKEIAKNLVAITPKFYRKNPEYMVIVGLSFMEIKMKSL